MPNFLSQDLIEEIRNQNDIVEVISEYVPLKKRGRNWVGLCPFHAEKKPSFSVNAEKQFYHCFGCGQGGNVISFLMALEKLSFIEAVKLLAKRANIPLPKTSYDKAKKEELDFIYYANQVANQYFRLCFEDKKIGKKARDYVKKRGFTPETVEGFSIGYAPADWEGLLRYAQKKDVKIESLSRAGLVVESQKGGYYDRFRNRLIFPVFNLSDKVVGFGGRVLDEKDEPKYLNSPETIVYQKGKILYGLNFSKNNIRDEKNALVVEGYMDLISLYQAGIKNLVASSGTGFTPEQARLLSRYAEKVFLFFDADSAGQQATIRSVDLLFDLGLEIEIVTLPPGEDPDSFVKKFGKQKIIEKINRAESYIDFKKNLLGKEFDQLSLREQEEVVKDLAQTAGRIRNQLRRNLFVTKAAKSFGINEKLIFSSLEIPKEKPKESLGPPSGQKKMEMEFLRLLMEDAEFVLSVKNKIFPQDLEHLPHQKVLDIIYISAEKNQDTSPLTLMDLADDQNTQNLISQIASLDIGTADLKLQLEDYLKTLEERKKETKIKRLKVEIQEAVKKGDIEKANLLTAQYQKLKTS